MTDNIRNFSSLAQWLAYCEQLHPKNIELGLERVQKVRAAMGLEFTCPVFVVAGTNGKGSTCAMLESILMAAGYKVGVYSSPHLVHFEERCRVNRKNVQDTDLLAHFAAVEAARVACGKTTLTYFEFTTLAILHYLSEQGLDAAVLEVGLGGRYDAVNIIENDCAIITSIDIDHVEFLGADRYHIGWEKAGIMRKGKPAVVSDPAPPESVVLYAQEIQADVYLLGKDYRYTAMPDLQHWEWAGRQKHFSHLAYPALPGHNQLLNCSGVLAALEALQERLPCTEQQIRQGLAQVALPGRFQIFNFPSKPVVVLDVGHNPHAAVALADNLKLMGKYAQTYAVFGAMADKDVGAVLKYLLPLVDGWYFTDLPTPRAMPAKEIELVYKALADNPQLCTTCSASPEQALSKAFQEAAPADRIVVFGSFYTVGGVLESCLWQTLNRKIE